MFVSRWSRPYAAPQEALADFLAFAQPARQQLEVRPEWNEWLLSPDIINPLLRRGPGQWELEWREAVGSASPDFEKGLSALRDLKQRESIRLGLLDFGGFPVLEEVMAQLSDLADFCLQKTLLLAQETLGKKFGAPGTPFTIIGLGKLGGQELDYSSDIDVMFLYGEEGDLSESTGTGRTTRHEFFTQLGQKLIGAFHGSDGAGGLFRLDLRLRPEGKTGQLVRSLDRCENYYAAFGETWERMMLVKARPSAGDPGLGSEFLRLRDAFSYPGHLTREILFEIAALKKRIESDVVAEEELDPQGSLGTGGIREIEFIVPSLQLIHGARHRQLQRQGTLAALEALETLALLPSEQVADLKLAYRFFRYVEHRRQMMDNVRTHTLPVEKETRKKIAESLGFSLGDFEDAARHHRQAVRAVFSEMFTQSAAEPPRTYPVDFFPDPAQARQDLNALLPEQSPSHSGPRVRQAFARLWPMLSSTLRRKGAPNRALSRFVQFVEAYGSHGLLYESLATNPRALELLLTLLDQSAHFSGVLREQPDLFEDVARSSTLNEQKSTADYLEQMGKLEGDLAQSIRFFLRGETLRLFVRDVMQLAPRAEIEEEFTALAEACLTTALRLAAPASPLAVIGLGRLGGRELTYGSALDCLIIGEDGAAARQVVKFMTEPLSGGLLFPIDFHRQPQGEGPVCLPWRAYEDYYLNHAGFAEFQALNRARFVAGEVDLAGQFLDLANTVWQRAGADPTACEQIDRTRNRIEKEQTDPHFPLGAFKTGRGGLLDIEFGLQRFLITRGHREPSQRTALEWMKRVHPAEAETWRQGLEFLRKIEAALRRDSYTTVSTLPVAQDEQAQLAQRLGFPTALDFLGEYKEQTGRIRAVYEQLSAKPI